MRAPRQELRGVPGTPPDLRNAFPGCPFEPRCDFRFDPCATVAPALRPAGVRPGQPGRPADWRVACHLHDAHHRPGGPPAALAGPDVLTISGTAHGALTVRADSAGGDA
jgi:peptide/nickel transport system ATP-binding protein